MVRPLPVPDGQRARPPQLGDAQDSGGQAAAYGSFHHPVRKLINMFIAKEAHGIFNDFMKYVLQSYITEQLNAVHPSRLKLLVFFGRVTFCVEL